MNECFGCVALCGGRRCGANPSLCYSIKEKGAGLISTIKGLSVFSVEGKAYKYGRILNERLIKDRKKKCKCMTVNFGKGRGSVDLIFAVKRVEKYQEDNRKLFVCLYGFKETVTTQDKKHCKS